jgi:hypothetical protein
MAGEFDPDYRGKHLHRQFTVDDEDFSPSPGPRGATYDVTGGDSANYTA